MAHNRHNLTWGFCHGRECGYLRNQLCLGWCEQCWHEWVDERGIDPLVRAAHFYPPELQLSTLQQLWLQQRRILRRLRGEDLFCYSRPPPPWCAPMAIRSSGELLPWRSDPVHHNNIMGLPWRPDPFIVGPSPNPPSPNPKPAKKMTSPAPVGCTNYAAPRSLICRPIWIGPPAEIAIAMTLHTT